MNEKKHIVLVVEDEAFLRGPLKEKLLHEGYSVSEAQNGEEGLKKALELKPDLILLDIVMPKMDGIDMARNLRKDEWGKNAKVVVLTNISDMDKIQEALENGIYEYFIKSDTKIEGIIEKVKEILL